jgi:hypothetical protein
MKNKLIPKFQATIDDYGKLHIKDTVKFNQYIIKLKGDVEIIVQRQKNIKNRGSQQNRYYWGIVLQIIAGYMGDDIESAHEAMKILFLVDNSRKLKTIKSTASLNTTEFEDYLSNIRMYMSKEHDVYIPKPNEVDF